MGRVGLAVVAALVMAFVASPAQAQAPAPPGGGSLMEQVVPGNLCSSSAAGPGRFPLSAYTIDYDEGGFTAVSRKAVGTLTEMTFAAARWSVSVGMWLIGWAFSFGFADRLAAPMAAVAGRYRTTFFVPLVGSALLIAAAYGGLQIFRGRLGRGLGEFVLSGPNDYDHGKTLDIEMLLRFGALALCLAATGIWSTLGPFWSLPTAFLSGTAAAGGIALINSVGNIGGFVGPTVVGFLKERTHRFESGLFVLAASLVVAGVLALSLRAETAD